MTTSIKERIALGEALTTAERDFVLDCINEATSPPTEPSRAVEVLVERQRLIEQRNAWAAMCANLNEVVAGFLDALPPAIAKLPGAMRAREISAKVRDRIAEFRP